MAGSERKHLLPRPAGPSETPQSLGLGRWNNASSGFCGDGPDDWEVCAICGTKHMAPGDVSSLLRMHFLGLEGFEECCGALLDCIYRESGEEFFRAYLAEFAANPTDFRFVGILDELSRRLQEASEMLQRTNQEVEKVEEQIAQLKGAKPVEE